MTIKNVMSKAAIVAVSIGLAAASAYAGPPRDSGRDVIGEASFSCGIGSSYAPSTGLGSGSAEEIRALACDLLFNSDGALDVGENKCKADPDWPDVDGNGAVTYKGRNCAKNEQAQQRKAASVVLSMDDFIKGKGEQKMTAAGYACEYADKGEFLESVEKLEFAAGYDLVTDAKDIAAALEVDCDLL